MTSYLFSLFGAYESNLEFLQFNFEKRVNKSWFTIDGILLKYFKIFIVPN